MTYKECAVALVESLIVASAVAFPIGWAVQIILNFYV